MKNCQICSSRARRDLVDAALAAGMSPATVWTTYQDSLGSRSSVYRHAGHSRSERPLAVHWVGDQPVGEYLADQARLGKSFYEQRGMALERGDATNANRAGHEAVVIFGNLLRVGIDTEQVALDLETAHAIRRLFGLTLWDHPETAVLMADVARRRLENEEFARDIEQTAEDGKKYFQDHPEKKHHPDKENA